MLSIVVALIAPKFPIFEFPDQLCTIGINQRTMSGSFAILEFTGVYSTVGVDHGSIPGSFTELKVADIL
jgi:hypothetical protein